MTLKKEREEKLQKMTREAIQKAAVNVMVERGLEGITMQRVADGAGLAKGTLYLYFDNKDELLEDTIAWCFKPLIEEIEDVFAADLDPDKKVARLFDFHHQFLRDHRKLCKMLFIDQQVAHSKDINENKQADEHQILQKASDLIQDGIEQGIFRDINPRAVATMMMESSMELNYQFLNPESSCNFGTENPATILKKVFLKGILKS